MAKPGRPRKTGVERHPNGRIVHKPDALGPTPEVAARRQAVLGDREPTPEAFAAAESPVALAALRGWITEADRRALDAYARLWRAAIPAGPRVALADLELDAKGAAPVLGDGDPEAMAELRRIWDRARFVPLGLELVADLALRDAWPEWVAVWTAHPPAPDNRVRHPHALPLSAPGFVDRLLPGRAALARERTLVALAVIREALRLDPAEGPRHAWHWEPEPDPASAPERRPGPTRTETTDYVTPEGETLFTVERRLRP